MRHSVVCYSETAYSAWPANGGMWRWGDEILVSFNRGAFDPSGGFHRISPGPKQNVFARSMDGGLTWAETGFDNSLYARAVKKPPENGFVFGGGFVMRAGVPAVAIDGSLFIVSNDRGHSWDGPYAFPDFGFPLTSRTSYHIEGEKTMRIFMSYSLPQGTVRSGPFTDRAFAALTSNGGLAWEKLGDMTDDDARSVMPSVVRLKNSTLVAAMRRRRSRGEGLCDDNWIECRRSDDNGRTWHTPVRAADTCDTQQSGNSNGNPPALCLLDDGTLVLAYGYRSPGQSSIRYCVSSDGGFTFKNHTVLRGDALGEDMGYPRITAGKDGRCVAVYYIATKERPVQHIEATVFLPGEAAPSRP